MADAYQHQEDARAAGLVLAGGRSVRFGREKALEPWRREPLIRRPLSALKAVCGAVAVSAAPGSGAEALARRSGLAVLHDDLAHARGPLAGVAAGLAWAESAGFATLVSLPCDTPGVGPAHLRALLAALADAPAAYATAADGAHALCAVWPTGLAAALAERLAAGDHPPVREVLASLGARAVRFDDVAAFANINRPGGLDPPDR